MIFDKKTWNKIGKGFGVYDGAYGFDGRLAFIFVEDKESGRDPLPVTRFVFARRERPVENRFYCLETEEFSFSRIAASSTSTPEFVAVDIQRQVLSYSHDYDGVEPSIDGALSGTDDYLSSIKKVIRVNATIYAIGWPNRIYKRLGEKSWELHSTTIPIPKELFDSSEEKRIDAVISNSLLDMSGFSDSDMYTVGEKGTVFRFDGKKWEQLVFPTNLNLCTVSCAADGWVYITDKKGHVWQGKNNTWKKISETNVLRPFVDAAWFDDKMWFSNDHGIADYTFKSFGNEDNGFTIKKAGAKVQTQAIILAQININLRMTSITIYT
ncbi:hypothetical protein [Flavobacterium sp. FlaQc-48]|uniref:hypothetical protein n=1 Tax=Flavobacterium sp. FlaQc-48 TaxID=3374181 RepID=UPI0037574988